jgi:hypothetical protein
MARNTIELNDIKSVFDEAMSSYPIFDQTHRATLNNMIFNHYRFREIGQETPARFAHYLKTAMHEIMPEYNQLYESAKLVFNPFESTKYKEEIRREINGESDNNSSSSNTTSVDKTVTDNGNILTGRHDTPQGTLEDLKSFRYLSSGETSDSNNTETTGSEDITTGIGSLNGTHQNIETLTRDLSGHNGQYGKSFSSLLIDFRKTILNIDKMIVNDKEIEECFFGLLN